MAIEEGPAGMAATPAVPPVSPLIAQSTGTLAKHAAVVVLVSIGIAAALQFLWMVRQIILWLVIGSIFAMALEPAVAWLIRRGLKRGPAAVLVTLLTVVVVIGVGALLAVPLVKQASEFVQDIPDYVDQLTGPDGAFSWVESRFHVQEKVAGLSPKAVDIALGARAPVMNAVRTTFSLVAAVVSIFTMMVLLLIEGPRAWAWVLSMIREDLRDDAGEFGHRLIYSVGGYVRGNGLISLVAGLGAWIVMRVAGVPFALTLAVIVALLDLIPLVGATIAMMVCVLVAATQGWVPALVVLIYFIVYQQVENNVIQPAVYSRTLALSPLAVLIATLCGAVIGGIIGVLLAIPAAATVYISIAEFQKLKAEYAALGDGAAGEGAAGGGGGAGAGADAPAAEAKPET